MGHQQNAQYGARWQDRASAKKRTYLSGDYTKDMATLRILGNIRNPQTRKDEFKNEVPQFITYLTLVLQNVSEIIGKRKDLSNLRDESSVKTVLEESGRLFEVASFLFFLLQ